MLQGCFPGRKNPLRCSRWDQYYRYITSQHRPLAFRSQPPPRRCNLASYGDHHGQSSCLNTTRLSFRYQSSSSSSSQHRPDPFARRPTAKCDPYGQDGKPLTLEEATKLLRTVEPEWKLLIHEDDNGNENDIKMGNITETTPSIPGNGDGGENNDDGDGGNNNNNYYYYDSNNNKCYDENENFDVVPFGIGRDFWHEDYIQASQFLTHVAAVAEMNAQHFPHKVILERKIHSRTKSWNICTRIICRTHVLQGLSHHDYYLATLIDIEIDRPEVRGLLKKY
ncbi:MAG: pterin-4a-carbinolamine dehydratase [Bacillariaceae sp.]|jgi:pterin-4a-carbinolamine dehydratase